MGRKSTDLSEEVTNLIFTHKTSKIVHLLKISESIARSFGINLVREEMCLPRTGKDSKAYAKG